MEEFINQLCEIQGFTLEEAKKGKMNSDDKSLNLHIVWYYLRVIKQMRFKAIGELFQRDHSTIVYGTQKIQEFIEVEEKSRVKTNTRLVYDFFIEVKHLLYEIERDTNSLLQAA